MTLAGCQFIADLHQADGALFFGDVIFPLLWCGVGIHVFEFLGCDKENFLRQDLGYVVILDRHIFFGFAEYTIDIPHNAL